MLTIIASQSFENEILHFLYVAQLTETQHFVKTIQV